MQDKKKLIVKMANSATTPNFSPRPGQKVKWSQALNTGSSRALRTGSNDVYETSFTAGHGSQIKQRSLLQKNRAFGERVKKAGHRAKMHIHKHPYSYIGLFLVIIIIIVIILWALGIFNHKRKHGKTKDETCKAGDCAPKHFCSGAGTCQEGNGGKKTGGTCTKSEECDVDNQCVSGKCELKTT